MRQVAIVCIITYEATYLTHAKAFPDGDRLRSQESVRQAPLLLWRGRARRSLRSGISCLLRLAVLDLGPSPRHHGERALSLASHGAVGGAVSWLAPAAFAGEPI